MIPSSVHQSHRLAIHPPRVTRFGAGVWNTGACRPISSIKHPQFTSTRPRKFQQVQPGILAAFGLLPRHRQKRHHSLLAGNNSKQKEGSEEEQGRKTLRSTRTGIGSKRKKSGQNEEEKGSKRQRHARSGVG